MLSYDAFRQLFAFPKRCSPYGNMYLHMLCVYYMCIVTNNNGRAGGACTLNRRRERMGRQRRVWG